MGKPVLTLKNNGPLLVVERDPVLGKSHLRKRGHHVADPLCDGLAPLEFSVCMLDVVGVLGKNACPNIPVPGALGFQSGFVVILKGGDEFRSGMLGHVVSFLDSSLTKL